MQIIYDPTFTSATRAKTVVLAAGAATAPVTRTDVVTGVALFDVTAADVVIEASDDDFATTTYSHSINAPANSLILDTGAISAAKWRVRSVAGGSVGQLYLGTLATVWNPTFPWSFAESTIATDRVTMGGVGYSKIRYTGRSGEWSWSGVPDSGLAVWRAWYAATLGFRRGFVIVDPLDEITAYLVNAPGGFPLKQSGFDWWEGRMDAMEVLRAA